MKQILLTFHMYQYSSQQNTSQEETDTAASVNMLIQQCNFVEDDDFAEVN